MPGSTEQELNLFERGEKLYKEGNLEESLDCFSQISEDDPNYARAVLYRGVLYLKLDNPLEAAEQYSTYVSLDGACKSDALNDLAVAYIQCAEKKPENKDIYLHMAEETLRHSDSLRVQAGTRPNPLTYYNLGNVYKKLGILSRAAEAYKNCACCHELDALRLYKLGDLYIKMGNLPEAAKAYENCARSSEQASRIWATVSNIYRRIDAPAESLNADERYVQYQANIARALSALESTCTKMGNLDAAAIVHENKVKQEKRAAELWFSLGCFYKNAGARELEINAYTNSVNYDRKNIKVWEALSGAYEAKGDIANAIKCLTIVKSYNPRDPAAETKICFLRQKLASPLSPVRSLTL